jgi:hypothetical protein
MNADFQDFFDEGVTPVVAHVADGHPAEAGPLQFISISAKICVLYNYKCLLT